ncbi:hypothetical protein ACJEI1_18855, partial [Escherichia coli]
KRAYCLKTQPATGETYPKSDLFNKASSSSERKSVNSFWSISNSLNLFEGNKKVGFIRNGSKALQA